MSRQLTVLLPDHLVAFIAAQIARGQASSRAAVVATAIERERRREIAEQHAAILARTDDDDGFAALAAFAARTRIVDLA